MSPTFTRWPVSWSGGYPAQVGQVVVGAVVGVVTYDGEAADGPVRLPEHAVGGRAHGRAGGGEDVGALVQVERRA